MARRYRPVTLLAASVAIVLIPFAESLLAQESDATLTYERGPGGYLSWWKMTVITVVFLFWVRLADWINRDAMKIGTRTKLPPEIWNPIVVFSFLLGFLLVITIPIFAAGLPIFLVLALFPFLTYVFIRQMRFRADASIKQHLKLKPGELPAAEALPQDQGEFVDFSPAGDNPEDKQANLIRARQTGGFIELKELVYQTHFKRTEQLMMDFTRDGVNSRILVDGTWHPLEPMDRETGDAILASMKYLAGLNPAERRARQSGRISFKSEFGKASVIISSQGVPSGERAQMKYEVTAKEPLSFSQLGMFPEMVEQVKKSLDKPGSTIISAPPGGGFTSSWQGALVTADRLTRDCVGVIPEEETETVVENIVIHRYEEGTEKNQLNILRTMLLTQPDLLAIPQVEDKESMDLLTLQVVKHNRSLLMKTHAKSAAEAILRMYAKADDRDQFLQAMTNVTCQRLLRRLCTSCRVETQVQPKVIQQLGGDPKTQSTIFNAWKLPPPEQRVDEKGREIEFPPCETCGGIGYIGRIAVFELLTLNEQLREFIKKNPKTAAIEQAAVKLGKVPFANEAYKLVLLGVTSLAEAQRMLKEQAK